MAVDLSAFTLRTSAIEFPPWHWSASPRDAQRRLQIRGLFMSLLNDQTGSPWTRGELAALAFVLLSAVGFRMAYPSRFAIEHFDEGVYASNLWFGADEGFQYPQRHLYAPPLVPWLLEWTIVFWGPSGIGPMLVSAMAGIATVALVWGTARHWFGPPAGLAAAILSAGSDFHLLYSRTALTDALLCFWLLAAIALFHRALMGQSLSAAAGAGLAAGAAWWTKYNGWLPLAITLAGAAAWLLMEQRPRRGIVRTTSAWAIMAAVAVATWSPVLVGLQSHGGYAAVAANHSRYIVGLENWWSSFEQQAANQQFLDGLLSCLAVGCALLIPALVFQSGDGNRSAWNWIGPVAVASLLLASGAAVVGSSVVQAGLAIGGFAVRLWLSRHGTPSSGASSNSRLAVWLLAAWFVALLLATPLYRPYPRLTLPWLVAAWLGAGAALGQVVRRQGPEITGRSSGRSRWIFAGAALLAGLAAFGFWISSEHLTTRGVPGWQPRTGLERIAGRIIADAADEARRLGAGGPNELVIYTYAEPAVFYHLRAGGLELVGPISNLDFVKPGASRLPYPVFLVVGPHALRTQEFRVQWRQLSDKFEPVATYEYQASDLVLLNEYAPERLTAERPIETVRLYRWTSSPAP